jgi:hypothetical protein
LEKSLICTSGAAEERVPICSILDYTIIIILLCSALLLLCYKEGALEFYRKRRGMGDHFVYKDVEGTSTEWDDIQRKLGNLPAKPPPSRPAPWIPAPDEKEAFKDRAWLDNKTEEELEELADDPDLDDDRFLEEYRWAYHARSVFPLLHCSQ